MAVDDKLNVQSAKPGHDTGRHGDRFFCRWARLAVRRDGLRRREDLDREHFFERVGLIAQASAHLNARGSDAFARPR